MRIITIIVPVYNEEAVVPMFLDELRRVLAPLPYEFDILFVNDGSIDATDARILKEMGRDPRIRYLEFSRNFGKEAATTAGLHAAAGDAALLIDADLQHPVELIPAFLKKWEGGAEVVIGVRARSESDALVKRLGSRVFYKIMGAVSETNLIPNATDYRLLDRRVIDAFNRFTEHERMTRGLIDWLGFTIALIPFEAKERAGGTASYSLRKLVRLAIVSVTSHSLVPLRFAGYLGAFIILVSIPLGIVMFIDHYVVSLGFRFSGPAMLADITLFLIGVVLGCLGLLAVYIGHIFEDTRNRPLYVISRKVNLE